MQTMQNVVATILLIASLAGIAQADNIEEQVDRYAKAELARSHTPGMSVGVTQHGKIVLLKGYGLANVELSSPATKDTVYEVLSVGKQFTAAGVLLLMQEGRVGLNDEVSAYLSDSPIAWKGVRVHHLLSHASGIRDYTDTHDFFEHIRDDATPEELLKPIKQRPLDFAPGTQTRYSNSNYYLLGLIIEKVSGKSFAQFMTERVFRPVGMNATRVNDLRDIIPGRSAGYHWLGNDADRLPASFTGYHGAKNLLQNAVYVSPTRKWAAGAVVSSVTDMLKWEQAISAGKLLKRQTWDLMNAPARTNGGVETPFGLGTEVSRRGNRRLAGHQGGGMAFNAAVLRVVDGDLAVVVLANQTSAPTQAIATRIASMYEPGLSYARVAGIAEKDPEVTRLLRRVLIDAQQGKADAKAFAASAARTATFIRRVGPRFLGARGKLKSLALLEERDEPVQRTFTYRAEFDKASIVWSFALDKDGKIVGLEPLEE